MLLPSGPDGAHQLGNRSDGPVRLLLESNFAMPRAAVRVGSNEIMIRGTGPDERGWFPLDAAADYWDGEGE